MKTTLLVRQLLAKAGDVDLRKVDSKLVPDEKVGKNEKVVGVLPDHLKQLYLAIVMTGEEIRRKCPDIHSRFEAKIKGKDSQITDDERKVLERHSVEHDWSDVIKSIL